MGTFARLVVALLGLAAGAAQGAFHLWNMNEIYSNADGSVQFLELSVTADGENLIRDHGIFSIRAGAPTQTYIFPRNLTFNTRGKSLLIGTVGFAALGAVTPDFVVPNGFFAPGGGIVNFADVDIWQYPALTNGNAHSLNRNGVFAINTPRNFAGETATLTASAASAMNFQSLWWNDPPLSESGWGLNIAHQGDILFVTWFTYDTDGSQMWLVMSNAGKTATNRYEGQIFRTTGPAFNVAQWNPNAVLSPPVGTGVLAFSNADRGTFSYTIGNVSQTKNIVRQEFSSPVSTCAANGATSPAGNYQDLWWGGLAESGWGINITHQGDILFATWFTYDANGRGMWIVMSAGRKVSSGVYTGELFRTTGTSFSQPWNPNNLTVPPVGTGTFTFSGNDNGRFDYTVNGITQSKAIIRQVYSSPATVCN